MIGTIAVKDGGQITCYLLADIINIKLDAIYEQVFTFLLVAWGFLNYILKLFS